MPVKAGSTSKKPRTFTDYKKSEWYFPANTDDLLFEHLTLAINIAGMNFVMVMNKKENFEKAFKQFDVAKVAKFGEKDVDRLMEDTGIIRNIKKIDATIENAKAIVALQKDHGSFRKWLDAHKGEDLKGWEKLFKAHFKFAGPGVTHMFLMGTGLMDKYGITPPDC